MLVQQISRIVMILNVVSSFIVDIGLVQQISRIVMILNLARIQGGKSEGFVEKLFEKFN